MESSHLGGAHYGGATAFPPADLRIDVLGRRFGAAVVDSIILGLSAVVLLIAGHGYHTQAVVVQGVTAAGTPYASTVHTVHIAPAALGLMVLGWFLYFFAFETMLGQTPGKMMFGIQVVNLSGRAASAGRVLARNLLRPIDGFFFYLPGFISLIVGQPPRQRIGDRVAGTTVARV